MIVECGFYNLDTEIKKRDIYTYFVARHKCNPTNVEVVFVTAEGLKGKKELCEFITKKKLVQCV